MTTASRLRVRSNLHMRVRRGTACLAVATLASIGLVATGVPAQAVHDTGAFELEGNAVNSAATPGDDWDNVCHQVTITNDTAGAITDECASAAGTSTATAVSWVAEPNTSASIFTGGGSKDPQDVSSWAWKDAGGLPDKDNLTHSFAARYSLTPTDGAGSTGPGSCPSSGAATCEVLYFGSDRFDNSGDAQQGFWFFQNAVGLGTNAVGGGTGFSGVHRAGDILVISNFSNGGGTSTITVYKWDPTCKRTGNPVAACADSNLKTLETSTSAKCTASLTPSDTFCGIVNPTNATAAPWSFTDKSGNHTYLNGELYEGGVNLSALGLGNECFSAVAAETRSSTSTTAVLKDFVLGPLGDCDSHIVTTPKDGNGDDIASDGLNIGTDGTVTARDSALVTVSGVSTWAGNVQFSLCGPAATAGCAAADATAIGSPVAVSSSSNTVLSPVATITSAGDYCWRAAFTSTTSGVPNKADGAATECFTVNPVQPTLGTSAGADVNLGSAVTDTATLAGTANQPGSPVFGTAATAGSPAGGTITFSLYGPSDTGCGDLFGTVTPATTVSGDDTYGPVSLTPTEPGTYHWKATYSGDSPNTLGVAHNDDCSDSSEDVVVTSVPSSLTTAQSFIPNDSATVSAPAGGDLAGKVTFQLFESTDCTGTAIYTASDDIGANEAAVAVSGASPQTVSTSNTTVSTTSANVSWLVSYDSTNSAQEDITATCLEKSALTIDDGGTATSP